MDNWCVLLRTVSRPCWKPETTGILEPKQVQIHLWIKRAILSQATFSVCAYCLKIEISRIFDFLTDDVSPTKWKEAIEARVRLHHYLATVTVIVNTTLLSRQEFIVRTHNLIWNKEHAISSSANWDYPYKPQLGWVMHPLCQVGLIALLMA